MLVLLTALLAPQSPTAAAPLRIALTPGAEHAETRPRWSPKGAKVALAAPDGDATQLRGSFALGPAALPPITVQLSRSDGAEQFDRLWIDLDRDGVRGDGELLTCTPKQQRGKWWSSFTATVALPVPHDAADAAAARPYPMALWFVADPQEPDAEPMLRWSRRGWHSGAAEVGGATAFVVVSEMEMDGVFDQRDAWGIGRSAADACGSSSVGIERHCWLDGKAWRPTGIDPHGRWIDLMPFDPGVTEEEEKAAADGQRADREAPRAKTPLQFGHDLAAALATAKQDHKRVVVDFATTWCGPCKTMDQLVWPAQAVLDACADVVPVKLDGDEQREIVKRYEVTAYPTVLVLDQDGKVLRRAVGYQSVAQLVKLLEK